MQNSSAIYYLNPLEGKGRRLLLSCRCCCCCCCCWRRDVNFWLRTTWSWTRCITLPSNFRVRLKGDWRSSTRPSCDLNMWPFNLLLRNWICIKMNISINTVRQAWSTYGLWVFYLASEAKNFILFIRLVSFTKACTCMYIQVSALKPDQKNLPALGLCG